MKATAGVLVLALAARAGAQVRIVSYNTLDGPDNSSDANFRTVFDAIRLSSTNGIAKRPDVIALQEQDNTSTSNLAALMNNRYGVTTYVGVQPGGQTATDRLGFVYDSSSVDLLGSVAVIPSGGTRPHLRAQFRPVGYTSDAASFYFYTSHLNASSASTRAIETAAMRANANALPAGSHIIYSGDFNIDSSFETSYVNLTGATGVGRTFDPLNRSGTWHESGNFADVHTQSTRVPQLGGGASGGMDDRFDFQLASGPQLDGEGLSYIGPTAPGPATNHSYRAFGNGGNTFNGNINDPQNTSQPANVLSALYNASDHLPIVADYQLPAKMSVSASPLPSRVIVDAHLPVTVTVTNVATAVAAAGADELDYVVAGSGAIAGNAAGTATSTLAGNIHVLNVNTSVPGNIAGTVNVTSSSQAAENATFAQQLSTTVLRHARPSFASDADLPALNLDMGIRARGAQASPINIQLFNRTHPEGFRAGLDIDDVAVSGDAAALSVNATTVNNLAQGEALRWTATLDTAAVGSFATIYSLTTSDENLPGASSLATLTITLTARVAVGGDANLDDLVNLSDYNILAAHYGSTGLGWTEGDFTNDSSVNLSDFNVLAVNYGMTAATSGPTPEDWAALASVVPEPIAGGFLGLAAIGLCRIRRRQGPL